MRYHYIIRHPTESESKIRFIILNIIYFYNRVICNVRQYYTFEDLGCLEFRFVQQNEINNFTDFGTNFGTFPTLNRKYLENKTSFEKLSRDTTVYFHVIYIKHCFDPFQSTFCFHVYVKIKNVP